MAGSNRQPRFPRSQSCLPHRRAARPRPTPHRRGRGLCAESRRRDRRRHASRRQGDGARRAASQARLRRLRDPQGVRVPWRNSLRVLYHDGPEHHRALREERADGVRDAAQSARIDVRVLPGMPDIEVSAAVIELCVKNYLSNAIKYADPAKPKRFVEISGSEEATESGEREVVVRVRDNGIGVPVDKRENLFERFFRAHEGMNAIEGTGLGLSIVRETAESQGGRAWAEYPDGGGSIFAIALPLRRKDTSPAERRQSQPPHPDKEAEPTLNPRYPPQ